MCIYLFHFLMVMKLILWIGGILCIVVLWCLSWFFMGMNVWKIPHGIVMDAQFITSTQSWYLQRFATGQYSQNILQMTGDFSYHTEWWATLSGRALVEYDREQHVLTTLRIEYITGQRLSYASHLFIEQLIVPVLGENILSGFMLTGSIDSSHDLFSTITERTRTQTKPSWSLRIVHRCPIVSFFTSFCQMDGKAVIETPLISWPIILTMQGAISPYFLQ